MDDEDDISTSPALAVARLDGNVTPTLTIIKGTGEVGRLVTLNTGEFVIGRSSESKLRLDDAGLSRAHSRLQVTSSSVHIEDLQSRNGTQVNGKAVTGPTMLRTGDLISLGPNIILRFAWQNDVEAEAQKKLFQSATRDVLTGLHNRAYLVETLQREFAFASRHGHPLAALMIDLDHFKRINDTWGHATGDEVLRRCAKLLQQSLRIEDVLGRYGGEEFIVLARELELPQALQLGERLRKVVAATEFAIEGQLVPVTLSIGAASTSDAETKRWEQLVERADVALYEAKTSGRNRVCPVARPSQG